MRSLSLPAAVDAVAFDAAGIFVVTVFVGAELAVVAVGVVVVAGVVVEVIIVLELLVELLVTTMGVGAGTFVAFMIGLICVDPILMGAAVGMVAAEAAAAAALAEAAAAAAAAAAAFAAAAFCCFMEAGVACRTVTGRAIVTPDARI